MRFRNCISKGVSRCREVSAQGRGGFYLASVIFVAIGSVLISNGCSKVRPVPPTPPPAAVTVAKPMQKDVIEWDTYTGYLDAKESVNVSARVSGLIVAAPFEEGSLVKKSQVLFVLDQRPFKADLDLKLADVEKAKAQVAIAQLNYQRMEDAHKRGVVSQQDYDTAKAECDKGAGLTGGCQCISRDESPQFGLVPSHFPYRRTSQSEDRDCGKSDHQRRWACPAHPADDYPIRESDLLQYRCR